MTKAKNRYKNMKDGDDVKFNIQEVWELNPKNELVAIIRDGVRYERVEKGTE